MKKTLLILIPYIIFLYCIAMQIRKIIKITAGNSSAVNFNINVFNNYSFKVWHITCFVLFCLCCVWFIFLIAKIIPASIILPVDFEFLLCLIISFPIMMIGLGKWNTWNIIHCFRYKRSPSMFLTPSFPFQFWLNDNFTLSK